MLWPKPVWELAIAKSARHGTQVNRKPESMRGRHSCRAIDVGAQSSVAASYHAWKVSTVQQSNAEDANSVVILQTKEKNQVSAIYIQDYALPVGLVPMSSEMKRKK